jgi:lipoyl(octanoyl) transferase
MELTEIKENIFIVERWNTEYLEVLSLQEKALELVRENPKWSIFILCNHPNCFTLGRGLQRAQEFNLLEFDPGLKDRLPFPLYEIKRGGGLTFHHPGQWVLYPIINLNKKNLDVYKIMKTCLSLTQRILEEKFQIKDLSHEEILLGLWHNKKRKVASIGLAVSHFVTYHGISVNIVPNQAMAGALKMVNPCGLPGDVYQEVESISPVKVENPVHQFNEFFKELIISEFSKIL